MKVDREPRPLPREAQPPITICIASNSDPNPPSVFGGLPATQVRITYQTTVHGRRFAFPDVWALKTVEIGPEGKENLEFYFSPEVGQAMSDAIFREAYPEKAYIDGIVSDRIKIPTSGGRSKAR